MTQTTTPPIEMERGFAGALAISHDPKMVLTGKLAASAVGLGKFVVIDQANGDDAVKLPAASADITSKLAKGFVMHAHSQESSLSGSPEWPQGYAAPILSKGQIYVEVEDAVSEGDEVFIRFQGGNEGGARSDVGGGDAVALPGAVYRSSTTGAGLAVVELNLPA